MTTAAAARPGLVGGRAHRFYTVVVFIVLASLDNVAIGLAPPLFSPIADTFGVAFGSVTFAIGATYLVSAASAVGWAYVGATDVRNVPPAQMSVPIMSRGLRFPRSPT